MYFVNDGTMTITMPFPFLTTEPMGDHPTVLANVGVTRRNRLLLLLITYNALMFSIKKYIYIYIG